MKKFFITTLALLVGNAFAATHLDTENRLWFTADVVKNAIVEFVPESQQQSVADLYQDLMDQTTGKISVDSLFKICRKAGFNTYKHEGFTQCKSFIEKMLTDAEIEQSVDLNGFCPGLDAKGNNPNKLRSITDKTRIGDFCSSTNIRMGQVIFKPGYNCSCMASVCNAGFEFQGGACVTKIAGHSGDCPRHAHSVSNQNNSLEKCQAFCEQKYSGNTCQFMAVVYDEKQCICSPTDAEIDAAYNAMQEKIDKLAYYAVCGKDKNKSGGTEICVEGVFNWVNVGRLQAAGLAEEYARVRYNDTVHCDTVNTRSSMNDDYIKCTSMNSKRYYEFEFDDVKESIDSTIQKGLVLGICKIHNVPSGISKEITGYSGSMKCKSACSAEMTKTARVFGLNATTSENSCNFSGLSMTASDAKSKLATIDGIDNYVLFNGIQVQGSQNVITQLRQYIQSTGKTVRSFDCNKNVGEIKNKLILGDDDVLRCTLNGQPIDFVFDDFSEAWLYVQEAGAAAIQCIVGGGKYAGTKCYGLTEQQCIDTNKLFLKKYPNASGMYWDGQECKMVDAGEAKTYDVLVQAGIGLVSGADCLLLTHTGCLLFAADMTALAAEQTANYLASGRADEFLHTATRCYERSCAADTLREAARIISVQGLLDNASKDTVDKELARLVGYLSPEDLSGVSANDWDSIITQLGGDPNDAGGTAIVVLGKIGLWGQMASIGISGLRFTSKAIMSLATDGSKIANAAKAAFNFTDILNNANTVSDVVDGAGDLARATTAIAAADAATDIINATDNVSDLANVATDAVHATDDIADATSDVARAADNVASSGTTLSSADELATVGVREVTDSRGRVVYQDMRAGNRFMSHDEVLRRIDELPSAADAARAADNVASSGVVLSWTDELNAIGVKETIAKNGVPMYFDTTTGKNISRNEVLRRIDEIPTVTNPGTALSSADELATVGVREITDSRGRVVYQDMRGGNQFMSHDEVLRRIDELPSATDAARTTSHATNATAGATDAARAADNVASSGVVLSWTDELNAIGVKETVAKNGVPMYFDTTTGKNISRNEVLRRIDEIPTVTNPGTALSSADELATVGVREITDSRGRVVYQDMRGGNQFMSHDEVLRRIDELPGATQTGR